VPKLLPGNYELSIKNVVSNLLSIHVVVEPEIIQDETPIMIASALNLSLKTKILSSKVPQTVTCNFGSLYEITNGLL
jgi:hypothetical protein